MPNTIQPQRIRTFPSSSPVPCCRFHPALMDGSAIRPCKLSDPFRHLSQKGFGSCLAEITPCGSIETGLIFHLNGKNGSLFPIIFSENLHERTECFGILLQIPAAVGRKHRCLRSVLTKDPGKTFPILFYPGRCIFHLPVFQVPNQSRVPCRPWRRMLSITVCT